MARSLRSLYGVWLAPYGRSMADGKWLFARSRCPLNG